MNNQIKDSGLNRLLRILSHVLIIVFFTITAFAQRIPEKPPRPISVKVSTIQHLNFGTIVPNGDSGGTVTVDYNSVRSYIGQIILPPSGYWSPALFEVTALPGTLISIVYGAVTTLGGSNSGSLTLTLGLPSTGDQFIARSTLTDVFIGGTLTIKSLSVNPAGFYSGTFTLTFNQN